MTTPAHQPRSAFSAVGSAIIAVSVALTVAVIFAPLTAILAVPFVIGVAVHHTRAIVRTAGSPTPFVLLLGLDIALLVVIAGSLLVGF